MNDSNPTSPTTAYTVYWRARDGKDTNTWKSRLTHAECEAEIRWCEGAHPEATLVWALDDAQGSDGMAHRIRVKAAS
jgi:hypothetical protein